MYIDGYSRFDAPGSVITVTRVSNFTLDLLNARDFSAGDPTPRLVVYSGAAFAGAGATLNIQFQGAPDNGAGAPGTFVTYAESSPIPVASMIAARKLWEIVVPRRQAGTVLPRFYQLNYVVAGGPFTAGDVSAQIVIDTENAPAYPPGLAILT